MGKLISIITPCFNEDGNVRNLRNAVLDVFRSLPNYDHEHIFIDNASKDSTVAVLRDMAAQDPKVKVIVNSRNFGHIRSPHHALLQTRGDAVIILVADLQDPPEMILDFVKKWEEGYKVVLGVKTETEESPLMFTIRKMYYDFISRVSEIELTKNNTGFGLYDKKVIEILKQFDDPYPYFRGMVSDIGFKSFKVPYKQRSRRRGITSNNFYSLYDMAMLGITNHSKVPLRLATMTGFLSSATCLFLAFVYLVAKLIFWHSFDMGIAPILIGIFLFFSLQLFFLGIIGEYIGSIQTQVMKRPLVIEQERINFEENS
jgi:glycosyltransferase involved in cell wall biosynthesis